MIRCLQEKMPFIILLGRNNSPRMFSLASSSSHRGMVLVLVFANRKEIAKRNSLFLASCNLMWHVWDEQSIIVMGKAVDPVFSFLKKSSCCLPPTALLQFCVLGGIHPYASLLAKSREKTSGVILWEHDRVRFS